MRRTELAEKLISAETEVQRIRLLAENPKQAAARLALALKNSCYKFWTTDPVKTERTAKALKSLLKFNPTQEIRAHSLWVSGIVELTKGKLEKSIENLSLAAETFLSIEKEREAANTKVAKLIALALLGRYAEAIETGKDALRIFEKFGDELSRGKIEKNLGNIVARQGDDQTAEKYYLAARKRFVKIGNIAELTMAENSLANTYAELNDFRRAEKFYASALENAKRAKMLVTEAEIEASMGNLAVFRGRYGEALKFLQSSREKYENLGMPHQTEIAELEIADIYLELNLAQEAAEIYRKTVAELHKLKMRSEEARARANFGRASFVLKDIKTARAELRKSAKLYGLEKNPIGAAAVKIAEAGLENEQENFAKSLAIAREAEHFLRRQENSRLLLKARLLQGENLRKLGKISEAERLLSENLSKSKKLEQPQNALASLNALGKLHFQTNDLRRAENCFKRAVRLVETLRAPLEADEFRMSFLADKLAPFENLARIYLAQKKLKQAFLMIESARARALAESLNVNPASQIAAKASPKLAAKLKNLREELNWFYSRLSRAEASEAEKLQLETERREREIADILRQIGSAVEARKTKSEALDLKKLQTSLGERKALIEFVCFDGVFSAFVVTNRQIQFFENLASEDELTALLEGLQFQFGALRYGAKNLGGFLPELKKRADFYLEKLYKKLIAPLAKVLKNLDLVVVPVGALHYVPFHALRRGERGHYLIENCEVVYAPGATIWQYLSGKTKRKKERNALLIGFADEKIPLVEREIKALQKIFPAAKTFTGNRATFSAYTENAAGFDVLHLACHGHFRPENPLFSSLHLADGWITVRDIVAQPLKAEIVTLSACETGLNKIYAGDEILGLARGFLAAGARNLVLSLWTVSDEATTVLMRDFYNYLQRGENVAASLKVAQTNFIRRGAHPYFWSPFALIGG